MKIFIDTSALAKRYIDEPGSDELEKFFGTIVKEVIVSTLALPELAAALARKVREKEMDEGSAGAVLTEMEKDWNGLFGKVYLDENLAGTAAKLCLKLPLKGADAVHLSSAMSAEVDLFVASDRILLIAAEKIGLRSYDPSTGYFE